MNLAHPSALRVQCRYCAPARFRWPFFDDQQDTQSRNRSHEKEDALDTDSYSECWLFLMRLGRYSQDVPSAQE